VEKTLLERKSGKICYLEIYTKDYRQIKFTFENFLDCNTVSDKIEELAFPEDKNKDVKNAFAFNYFIPNSTQELLFENGWDVFGDPQKEFIRQGCEFNDAVIVLT
jgi:hypothetical protein